MEFFKLYCISIVTFLALDSIWLGLIAARFYKSQIGHLLAARPNFFAAGIFYALFILGLVFFVIQPSLTQDTWFAQSMVRAALFGLVAYATYDLTSQAIIKDWPWIVTLVDLAWGACISAVVAAASLGFYHALLK